MLATLEESRALASNYFAFQSRNKPDAGTSSELFSRIPLALTTSEYRQILASHPSAHAVPPVYATLYPQWECQMVAGFNLVFCGYGSKRTTLDPFIERLGETGHLFVLRAFERDVSLLSFLRFACKHLALSCPLDLDEAVSLLRATAEPVYLVVWQIDAPALRDDASQEALSLLAASAHIRVISTVEAASSAGLWSPAQLQRFRWVWHDISTLIPFSEAEAPSLLAGACVGASDLAASRLAGARFVLQNLGRNAQGVYSLLAESGCGGLSYYSWFQLSMERFLVSSEPAFRTQLAEFIDHELVESRDDNFSLPLELSGLAVQIY